MNEEKELNEWNSYHVSGPRQGNPRVGALSPPTGLPGLPVTPAERRIAGKEAPKTPLGVAFDGITIPIWDAIPPHVRELTSSTTTMTNFPTP